MEVYTNTVNFSINRCFLRVRNLVSDIKERAKLQGVWEQGVEENILTDEEGNNKRLDKIAYTILYYTIYQILLGWSSKRKLDRYGM